jgi:hypothetical protein
MAKRTPPDDPQPDGDDNEPAKRDEQERPEPGESPLRPVKERIGEGGDNLRRRESWFRKRSGPE